MLIVVVVEGYLGYSVASPFGGYTPLTMVCTGEFFLACERVLVESQRSFVNMTIDDIP